MFFPPVAGAQGTVGYWFALASRPANVGARPRPPETQYFVSVVAEGEDGWSGGNAGYLGKTENCAVQHALVAVIERNLGEGRDHVRRGAIAMIRGRGLAYRNLR